MVVAELKTRYKDLHPWPALPLITSAAESEPVVAERFSADRWASGLVPGLVGTRILHDFGRHARSAAMGAHLGGPEIEPMQGRRSWPTPMLSG